MSESTGVTPEILDQLTKTCLCKQIKRAKIKKLIRAGARSFAEIHEATGAGTGACHGARCIPKVEELIEQYEEGLWS
ncbi:hypothetical protein ABB02_00722 [Clostridiaceae bacterium JG1575]|nr:hypothetical protein ABB02_00722 [Clostridiaceae bacterium JG1575]